MYGGQQHTRNTRPTHAKVVFIPPPPHLSVVTQRDIPAGDELTYDYRFNGDELLPCNCGAASCRGLVNIPDDDEEQQGRTLWVPRAQLAAAKRGTAKV